MRGDEGKNEREGRSGDGQENERGKRRDEGER